MMNPVTIAAIAWGEVAAERLSGSWLGRVWESDESALLLVDQQGEVLRLVGEQLGNGPFHIVLPRSDVRQLAALPRQLYGWRVGNEIWLGDNLTIQLPSDPPWNSLLRWRETQLQIEEEALARHLAWLADWVLARAPEASFAGLLPEVLAAAGPIEKQADRPDLPLAERLFRWRAARVLGELVPALATGELDVAEKAINSTAGMGSGTLTAGDNFILGLVAGLQLWPNFAAEGSGLRVQSLLQRLVRSAAERTNLLGQATFKAALAEQWGEPWHALYHSLIAADELSDQKRQNIETTAAQWVEQDPAGATAALAGLLAPFLWYQRYLTA